MDDFIAILKGRAGQIDAEKKWRNEEKIIQLHRRQEGTNNPAIAKLEIKFPESINPPEDLVEYYKERKLSFNISAPIHEITKIDKYNYFIEIRSVLPMYKWMEFFIKSFIRDYGQRGKGYKIQVSGFWEKYDHEVENKIYG